MNKIRKGDEVIVIAGKDRVRKARGKVLARVDDSHLIVEGVNLAIKHVKPNPMKGTTGGKTEKPMPIDQSNVAIYNPKTGKADRVKIQITKDGDKERKVRVYKSTGEEIKTSA
ncbi:50S ribosomal protein L24 [Saezia sanguinis]|uniref:50S ribosomal protein L24 n=1 Tax=Saezia sanguinis TaxID=1965230 RepID=UPI00306B960A